MKLSEIVEKKITSLKTETSHTLSENLISGFVALLAKTAKFLEFTDVPKSSKN